MKTNRPFVVAVVVAVAAVLAPGVAHAEPPSNDDITSAIDVSLGEIHSGDLASASGSPGEVVPSCDPTATQSVWYRHIPAQTGPVSIEQRHWAWPAISVHRADMSEVDCVAAGRGAGVFAAEAGQIYYIRIAQDVESARAFQVEFKVAPALAPALSAYPDPASIFSPVNVYPYSGDPLQRPFVTGEVRFGDGTSAQITGSEFYIPHQYAVDGTYHLELTGATRDGRTGSATTSLKVETHDVALTSLAVPASARAGQNKPITVTVANTRYPENATVTLYKQVPGGSSVEIGAQTQYLPVGQTQFPFAYTYSAADAAAGSVTFHAGVTLRDAPGDTNPGNNWAAATTTVRS